MEIQFIFLSLIHSFICNLQNWSLRQVLEIFEIRYESNKWEKHNSKDDITYTFFGCIKLLSSLYCQCFQTPSFCTFCYIAMYFMATAVFVYLSLSLVKWGQHRGRGRGSRRERSSSRLEILLLVAILYSNHNEMNFFRHIWWFLSIQWK